MSHINKKFIMAYMYQATHLTREGVLERVFTSAAITGVGQFACHAGIVDEDCVLPLLTAKDYAIDVGRHD